MTQVHKRPWGFVLYVLHDGQCGYIPRYHSSAHRRQRKGQVQIAREIDAVARVGMRWAKQQGL